MNSVMITAVARHILTAAGGFAIGKGWIDAAATEAVVGSIVTLVGVGWSLWEKKSR